jgi:hypothetical protein
MIEKLPEIEADFNKIILLEIQRQKIKELIKAINKIKRQFKPTSH